MAGRGYSYLVDERRISQELNLAIPYPIRLFNLTGLCINQENLVERLAPTFSVLEWDQYDVKRGQVNILKNCFPEEVDKLDRFLVDYYAGRARLTDMADLVIRMSLEDRWRMERIRARRKRSIAKFMVNEKALLGCWDIQRIPASTFSQNVSGMDDLRVLARVFDEASDYVVEWIGEHGLIRRLVDIVKSVRPNVNQLMITMHQVCIFAELECRGDNSPEGIHQDGSDYIVSALVIERDGIIGGESVIYGPDKRTEYFRHTLMPGQGLFQADRNTSLWHYVTPISEDPITPPSYGKRSILGFDIDVTGEYAI